MIRLFTSKRLVSRVFTWHLAIATTKTVVAMAHRVQADAIQTPGAVLLGTIVYLKQKGVNQLPIHRGYTIP